MNKKTKKKSWLQKTNEKEQGISDMTEEERIIREKIEELNKNIKESDEILAKKFENAIINGDMKTVEECFAEEDKTVWKGEEQTFFPIYKSKDRPTLLVNLTNERGNKPIYWAAERNQVEMIRYLNHKGGDLNSKDEKGDSPLLIAVRNGNFDCVECILKRLGPSALSVLNQPNSSGITPLIASVETGQLEMVQYLINQKADLELVDRHKNTALLTACEFGLNKIIILLLNSGARINVQNKYGLSPMSLCATYAWPETAKILLEYHADINLVLPGNVTCLHLAAGIGNSPEMVKLLLKNGAKISEKTTLVSDQKAGNTPLFNAAIEGNNNILEILFENGATISDIEIEDNKIDPKTGNDILNGIEVSLIRRNFQTVKYLLSKGGKLRDLENTDDYSVRRSEYEEWLKNCCECDV